MTTAARTEELPLDWDEWRSEWRTWENAHAAQMRRTPSPFQGKNFLADDVLGVWKVNGRTVELSEMTFPNLEVRDPQTGRLLEGHKRRVGITFADGETAVVGSFAQLEQVLGL